MAQTCRFFTTFPSWNQASSNNFRAEIRILLERIMASLGPDVPVSRVDQLRF
jgi:hypothetical protein